MKLWIPTIGDAFRLDSDWSFHLHGERRNDDLFIAETGETLKGVNYLERSQHEVDVTLPAGTELIVDRVYIRQGGDEYASVTFVLKRYPDKAKVDHFGARFWAKLEDVNRIDCTPTDTGNPVGPMSKNRYRLLALPDDESKKRLAKAARTKANKEELETIVCLMKDALKEEYRTKSFSPISQHLTWMKLEIARIIEDDYRKRDYSGWKTSASYYINRACANMLTSPWNGKRRNADFSPKSTSRRKDGTTVRKFIWSDSYPTIKLPGFTVTSRGTEILSIEPMKRA